MNTNVENYTLDSGKNVDFFQVPARHFVKQCMWADHEVPFILWHLILGFNGVTALHG